MEQAATPPMLPQASEAIGDEPAMRQSGRRPHPFVQTMRQIFHYSTQ
jgi:hypothetical protein